MKRQQGVSLIELLIVMVLVIIIVALALVTLAPHQRVVKTDDACNAIFSFMRQARIEAITRRQYMAVVINSQAAAQNITLSNSTLSISFVGRSVSIVDMGSINSQVDESINATRLIDQDIIINGTSTSLPASSAFPAPERSFAVHNFATASPVNTFTIYFDPAGRAVDKADNTGSTQYRVFYFSTSNINISNTATLLRALTIYGSTGGAKSWHYDPIQTQWLSQG